MSEKEVKKTVVKIVEPEIIDKDRLRNVVHNALSPEATSEALKEVFKTLESVSLSKNEDQNYK